MRLFSWPGVIALACAAGGGFLAGEAVCRNEPVVIRVCDGGGELCEAPPDHLTPPQPLEEIDLTCPSMLSEVFGSQSMEPPLADGASDPIRTVHFELPAGSPVGPDSPPYMPYLTDDGAPAPLPFLGDVPLLTPVPVTPPTPDSGSPIYQAATKFVGEGAKLPEVTDKVPLGKPPVSEQPPTTGPDGR